MLSKDPGISENQVSLTFFFFYGFDDFFVSITYMQKIAQILRVLLDGL